MLVADEVPGPVDSGYPRSGQAGTALTGHGGKRGVKDRVVQLHVRNLAEADRLANAPCAARGRTRGNANAPGNDPRGAANEPAAYQRARSRATSLERWICLSLQPGLMLIDWPRAL